MTLEDLLQFLRSRRFRLNSERQVQDGIAAELERAGVAFERECRLSPADIVDFFVHGVALEVKTQGSTLDIYRQLERYSTHERVRALVLASSIATTVPEQIGGKPAHFVNLGRAWL